MKLANTGGLRQRRAEEVIVSTQIIIRLGFLTVVGCGALPEEGVGETSAAASPGRSTDVLLQGFHWQSHLGGNSGRSWYQEMQTQAQIIGNAGFTHVWFPPPSDSAAAEGYLPRRLDRLDSAYGTESQLRNAISALSSRGVRSVADVVVNHRVGTTSWADFTEPAWPSYYVASTDEWNGPKSINADSGVNYHAARDIDHINPAVRTDIVNWLNIRLKSVGFSGWRFDFVKGFSGAYVGDYAGRTSPDFCVGELWNDFFLSDNGNGHRQDLMNWIDATGGRCSAFDFTTKGLLNQVLRYGDYWRLRDTAGRPSGAIGWWPANSVTFVDNHDTGPSRSCSQGQNHWPVPCGAVLQGYAYILTHPGVPTVYWAHYFNWNLGGSINALMNIRKSQGLHSESAVNIVRAENGLYAATIDGNTAMKIGWGSWSPGGGWTLRTSGTNYAVWTR